MEDIRKLLNDEEARIAPESLGYVVYGLTCALVDELRDGVPSEPAERRRHLEKAGALSRAMELYSAAMARYMGRQVDDCLTRME